MPIFDKGLSQALGQPKPLDSDSFTATLVPNNYLACFTDGIEEKDMAQFLMQGQVNEATVTSFVKNSAISTNDDATLLLYQFPPDAAANQMAVDMQNYSTLSNEARTEMLGNFNLPITPELVAAIQQAFDIEGEDWNALRLVGLLIKSQAIEKNDLSKMLTTAIRRGQHKTGDKIKNALFLWNR